MRLGVTLEVFVQEANYCLIVLIIRKFLLVTRLALLLTNFHPSLLVLSSSIIENKLTPSSLWQPYKYWKADYSLSNKETMFLCAFCLFKHYYFAHSRHFIVLCSELSSIS